MAESSAAHARVGLGVNVDHVATVRQARRADIPDPVEAALASERGGADGITVHLREDRRHIQDRDVERLKERLSTKLNLEMAATAEMCAKALAVRPRDVCIVPERRQELTTEGGLDVVGQRRSLSEVVQRLEGAGIRVSLFIDPDASSIDASREVGATVVELHTGAYADRRDDPARAAEIERLRHAAARAQSLGLQVNAGHGLTLGNVAPIAAIAELVELNIGHSIVARALIVGMEVATREMRQLLDQVRAGT